MSLTALFSLPLTYTNVVVLGIKLKSNVCEVLEVDITSFALKSSYCSKGATQKGKSELCPYDYVCHDRCI